MMGKYYKLMCFEHFNKCRHPCIQLSDISLGIVSDDINIWYMLLFIHKITYTDRLHMYGMASGQNHLHNTVHLELIYHSPQQLNPIVVRSHDRTPNVEVFPRDRSVDIRFIFIY